ncbi:MAG: acyltransferase family protein [Hellea sp.]
MTLKYRAEIDGLRAIAVASVVIFHAYAALLPGGFVGVDIFFVISGFLITTILLQGMQDKSFSFAKFYERRFRRLIPPLAFMLTVSFGLALVLLSADALRDFLWSLLATLGFSANWFFAFTADYFGGPAHTKPLLHMWSLGVEEQYYIIMPLLLLAALKMRALLKPILIFLLVSSFIYSFYLSLTSPNFAFYGIFSRFWELGIGSALAVFALKPPRSQGIALLSASIGLVLIVGSFFVITETAQFPAPWAAIPVFGTAIVIWATKGQNNFAVKLLSIPPMVFLGKISYALYLWHWPLLLFVKIQFPQWGHWTAVAAIGASILLSWASLELLENPIRRQKWFKSTKSVYLAFLAFVAVFAGAAAYFLMQTPAFIEDTEQSQEYQVDLQRLQEEWHLESLKGMCWVNNENDFETLKRRCAPLTTEKNDILIIGDSHAASWRSGIKAAYPESNVWLMAVNSCQLNVKNIKADAKVCRSIIETLKTDFNLSGLEHIVISSLKTSSRQESFIDRDVLEKIASRSSTKVTIMGPIPFYEPSQIDQYQRFGHLTRAELNEKFTASLVARVFDADKNRAREYSNHTYASPMKILCPTGPASCRHLTTDGLPLTLDDSHVSTVGSIEVIAKMVESGELDLSLPEKE